MADVDQKLLAEIAEYIKVDPESPSGLRWIKNTGDRPLAGKIAGSLHPVYRYWRVVFFHRTFACHRLVLLLSGVFPNPDQTHTDHIDRNPSNNLLENLRWVTPSENMLNRNTFKVSGKVPYRYVQLLRGNRYVARYWDKRTQKSIYVGCFKCPKEAHLAALHHQAHHFSD